jgi:hypothetical protein
LFSLKNQPLSNFDEKTFSLYEKRIFGLNFFVSRNEMLDKVSENRISIQWATSVKRLL